MMNPLYTNMPTTIFEVMSSLARSTGAINLGQGFPDDPGPADVRAKAAEAVEHGYNQYPPMMGLPILRTAIAEHYGRMHGLVIDAERETLVTSGATEALAAAILATVQPGDEVVLFQPVYDAYGPLVRQAGGVPKYITLKPPHWTFSEEDLAAVFTPRTRIVVLNNPLNPTGVVYARDQLALLAAYCVQHDVIAICDEVWEHLVFGESRHISMLTLPNMRARTIKIGSAGKMFSLTGWKVGLVVAAPPLLQAVAKVHQFLTFTTPPSLQVAVAYGLGKDKAFFESQQVRFSQARDHLTGGLKANGYKVMPSQGTYFINIEIGPPDTSDDVEFCQRLVQEFGVAAIPVSAFYADHHVRNVVRLCFAKHKETLDAALERLAAASPVLNAARSQG